MAEQFGSEFVLDVVTPAEAVQALICMLKGFRAALVAHPVGWHVLVGSDYRDEGDLTAPCARSEVIELIPAIAGSSDTARVIVGAVLVVVGAVFYEYGGGFAVSLGLALIAGGVAGMLAPKPKTAESSQNGNITGFAFSSGVNTTGQGVGMSMSFGRGLSTTHVVSAQVISEAGVFLADVDGDPVPWDLGENVSGPADISFTDAMSSSGDPSTDNSWGWSYDGSWTATDPTGDNSWTSDTFGGALSSISSDTGTPGSDGTPGGDHSSDDDSTDGDNG
jgi:predicted phage tail protein